jgi:hypothetical protein
MGVITTGQTFASGDQVTSTKLNDIANQATFTSAAETTDHATLTVSGGKLKVKDNGIGSTQLASDAAIDANRAVETNHIKDAQVTSAKLATIANLRVLGNVSGSTASPTAVEIKDEDDMASDSATAVATQQSIKAYVGTQVATAITTIYKSAETTIPATNTTIEWTHSLGQTPDLIKLSLICETAEFGYAVGDEIDFTSHYTYNIGVQTFWANTTKIGYRSYVAAGTNVFNIAKRDVINVVTPVTNANWKIIVRGFVF